MDRENKKTEYTNGTPKGRRPRIHKQPSPVVRSNDGSEAFDAPRTPSRKKVIARPEKADDTSSANRPSRGSNRRGSHTKDKNRPKKHPVPKIKTPPPVPKIYDGTTRLNKYLANAGICSRREADKIIAAGGVSVNGNIITEMGYQVHEGDVVKYGGETLQSERKRYFLLNKPKGFITTVDDPQERETVMMLVDGACKERIYPVGRLDRNTTGLLLFTNDGDLARRLTHPSTKVYKIYQVEVDKPVTHEDMKKMLEGIELEDGPIHVDDIQYVQGLNDKRIVGVELHSGKNRIVRRIFEHLGYDVHKLDRVVFAGLTKKDLPRGRYRELTPQEIGYLKMI
ncbi:MAG: rRNA pseudouridine synthase [Bacteroidales bacterium]|nr:rRNA pseudouridine synthase [Bacteroidales bacterium]